MSTDDNASTNTFCTALSTQAEPHQSPSPSKTRKNEPLWKKRLIVKEAVRAKEVDNVPYCDTANKYNVKPNTLSGWLKSVNTDDTSVLKRYEDPEKFNREGRRFKPRMWPEVWNEGVSLAKNGLMGAALRAKAVEIATKKGYAKEDIEKRITIQWSNKIRAEARALKYQTNLVVNAKAAFKSSICTCVCQCNENRGPLMKPIRSKAMIFKDRRIHNQQHLFYGPLPAIIETQTQQ